MAVGKASGEDRARMRPKQAISSQLLDITIDGARGILFNVTGGTSLTLFEVNQAAAIIKETAHPDVNLIFGAVIDPKMGDEIRITVIATGFDRAGGVRPVERPLRLEDNQTSSRARSGSVQNTPVERPVSNSASSAQAEFQRVINTDDYDIPAFLRNRKK